MRLNLAQHQPAYATAAALAVALCFAACTRDDDEALRGGADQEAAGAAAAASGGAASGEKASGSAAGDAVPAQCGRASGLDGPGAPRDSCTSKRASLTCALPGGVTELCLSDDLTKCPADPSGLGASAVSCTNQCASNEYAVTCGGIGPNIGNAAPPENCKSLGPTPGGPQSFCCPCL